jgi:hypothetical protein
MNYLSAGYSDPTDEQKPYHRRSSLWMGAGFEDIFNITMPNQGEYQDAFQGP